MRSEKDLHIAFAAWLKKQGIVYFHSRMDAKTSQAIGDPDFICVKGAADGSARCATVEFKFGKNRLSGVQEERIGELRKAGCETCVAYDLQTAVCHIEASFGSEPATGHPGAPEQALSEGGDAKLSRSHSVKSIGAGQSNPEPAPKLYQISSAKLGPVVVKYEGQREIYVRIATAHDRITLPMGKR